VTTTIEITSGKHMLLTTFRKSGAEVATPVWTVPVSDDRVGMWAGAGTGKYQRLRNNPHVTIQACTAKGKTKPGASVSIAGAGGPAQVAIGRQSSIPNRSRSSAAMRLAS
jgi:uncharacterized protein